MFERNSKRKVSRKKNITFLVISLLLLTIINTGITAIKNFIVDYYSESLSCRTLYITYGIDEDISRLLEEINTNKLVLDYGFSEDSCSGKIVDGPDSKMKTYSIKKYSDAVYGKYVYGLDDGETLGYNDIVIARYYLPEDETMTESKTSECYDAVGLVGKEICLSFKRGNADKTGEREITLKFRIAGVVDSIAYSRTNVAYVSEDMHKYLTGYVRVVINDEEYISANPKIFIYTSSINDAYRLHGMLREKYPGYHYFIPGSEIPGVNVLSVVLLLITNVILGYVIVSTTFNIIFYVRDDFRKRRREYGIMKAMGYKTKHFVEIFIGKSAAISAVSISAAVIITELMCFGLNHYIKNNMNLYFRWLRFNVTGGILTVVCAIGIISPLIGYATAVREISRLQAAEALRIRE